MKTSTLFLASALSLASSAHAELLAIRVGRAETVSKGVIEHAVILVEDGKIVTIGEDLPVERGIRIVDRPSWTVMPGLVNCWSRVGLDSEGGDESSPEIKARDELYPEADEYQEIVKYGVTTLGLYPAGNGIPGQAVAVRPLAKTADEMVLGDPAYLKIVLRADSGSKKRVTDGFKKADDYAEKEKKAREKFDKDQEKKKGSKKSDDKKEEKKDEEKKGGVAEEPKSDDAKDKEKAGDGYVPPEPDAKQKPWVDLRAKKLRAVVSITSAAEYLHWIDALGKEEIDWDLRLVLNRDADFFYVLAKSTYDLDVDGIGDRKVRAIVEPVLTLTPNTMRTRNLPKELAKAGAKVVFIPRGDDMQSHRNWLANVGEVVAAGLDRATALRALTLEPAELMGVGSRVGSLDKGKDANMVFLDGDPFQPATRIQAVMLDGRFVHGDVTQ